MKLIVDRDEWYRGNPNGSRLVRIEDKCKCCVGIYLTACGVNQDAMLGVSSAHHPQVVAELGDHNEWLVMSDGENGYTAPNEVFTLYRINDDPDITEEAREEAIKVAFAAHGVEVEFIN